MHHDPRFRLEFRTAPSEARIEVVARAVARSGAWLPKGHKAATLMLTAAGYVRALHEGKVTEAEAKEVLAEIDALCPAESPPDEWFAADVATLAVDFAIDGEVEDAMYALNSALIGAYNNVGPVTEAEEMLEQIKDLHNLAKGNAGGLA